jgi:uncharacterized protein (DUF1800 family)
MLRTTVATRVALTLLVSGVILAGCASNGGAGRHADFPPPSNVFKQAQVDPDLLLNRLSFGANASSSKEMHQLGMDQYLDQQLQGRKAIVPPAIQAQIDKLTISQKPFEQLLAELEAQRAASEAQKGTDDTLRKAYQQELTRLQREAGTRFLLRAVYSQNQLQEQMTWFWMNHFSVYAGKANLRAMVGDYEERSIRPHALGYFSDLLYAATFHPAMLRYLDNEFNAVNAINENFARELLELHTMGVGSGYTQRDVQELARVLTGMGINQTGKMPNVKPTLTGLYLRQNGFEFNPNRHDFKSKEVLGEIIPGDGGLADVNEVLKLLCKQPATARFISKKLALYFVSDTPSDALVEQMAQRFLQTKGYIPAVLRTMFDSPEFIASLGKKFKDPVHYVIGGVRLAYDGTTIVNTTPMWNWLSTLGQQLNNHLTPDGYSLTEMAWASPSQMTTRFEIARGFANGNPQLFKIDGVESKEKPPQPALANSDYAKKWAMRLSPETQQALKQAQTPQEWNVFLMASPEMMRR